MNTSINVSYLERRWDGEGPEGGRRGAGGGRMGAGGGLLDQIIDNWFLKKRSTTPN